jgi:hypothetical protein
MLPEQEDAELIVGIHGEMIVRGVFLERDAMTSGIEKKRHGFEPVLS